MPPAPQHQLRSAARKIAQQSTSSIRQPSRREFQCAPALQASEPPRDDGSPEADTSSTPIAQNVRDIEKTSKDLRELYADLVKQRAHISKLLKKHGAATPDKTAEKESKTQGTPGDDEPPLKPEQVISSFHGSTWRRRLRGFASREAQKNVQEQAPRWFLDRNVQLHEDQYGLESFAALTGVVERPGSTPNTGSVPDDTSNAAEAIRVDAASELHGVGQPLKATKGTFEVQLRELETIARGLLRLATHEGSRPTTTDHDGPDLILDHESSSSNSPGAVWRDLVENLAMRLDCDFVVLNAQDIGELVASAGLGDEITSEAISLNYDVSNKIWKTRALQNIDPTTPQYRLFGGKQDTPWKDEVMEDDDDLEELPMDGRMPSFGTPMMIGRPFTIDITKMLRARAGRRGGPRKATDPYSIMSNLFDEEPTQTSAKDDSHIFNGVVRSVLSAPEAKRSKAGIDFSQAHTSESSSSNVLVAGTEIETKSTNIVPLQGISRRRLLIYVSAFDVVEDHSIGRQFLSELYLQAHRRRMSGQELIIVGAPPYVSEERSGWNRNLDNGNATRRVALTPPDVAAQDVSRHRKLVTQYFTAANYRNLRTMLQTKWNAKAWKSLDPRSETFMEDVARTSSMPEIGYLWELSYVRQLAAVIWGMLEQYPDTNPSISEAVTLLEESAQSKREWRRQRSSDRPSHLLVDPEDTRISKILRSATKHEKALLAGVIQPSKISVTFKDVHAPFETIESIQTMTTLSLVRPEAFRYGVLASDRLPGLLLYGPPGTGKTLLAKAVAKESGATVLSVSSAQLNDMYVGEGEKNVAALFSLAKKLTPCVIFLDEADAIFSARGNRGSRVNHRELLNQFLTEWDGMSNDASGAFIMVATNRPMDLDDAVLRRLPRRLLVDLPSEIDRLSILKIHLRDEVLDDGVNLAELAKKTPFYSGSDLKNLAVAAALECVREENEAAKKHVGEEAYKYAEKRVLTAAHFEKALGEISASISEDMTSLREIKKFDEQYGDKRGKKRKSPRWGFSSAAEADKVLDTVKVRS